MKGITTYSEKIPGNSGNYHWSATFENIGGFIGITQEHFITGSVERVLLSPRQVKALIAFVTKRRPR